MPENIYESDEFLTEEEYASMGYEEYPDDANLGVIVEAYHYEEESEKERRALEREAETIDKTMEYWRKWRYLAECCGVLGAKRKRGAFLNYTLGRVNSAWGMVNNLSEGLGFGRVSFQTRQKIEPVLCEPKTRRKYLKLVDYYESRYEAVSADRLCEEFLAKNFSSAPVA